MDQPEFRYYREAIAEVREARRWYHVESPAVAMSLTQELRRTLMAIHEAPLRWPILRPGYRRLRLRRFPYMVVYRVSGINLDIVALAHLHRRAGYWKDRKPETL